MCYNVRLCSVGRCLGYRVACGVQLVDIVIQCPVSSFPDLYSGKNVRMHHACIHAATAAVVESGININM